jgi:hypothetical protein
MRLRFPLHVAIVLVSLAASAAVAHAQAPAAAPSADRDDSFYSRSLHFTDRGLLFNYDRGLRRLTGFPAERLGCAKASCHVKSCDTCHKVEVNGKAAYSVAQAKSEKACAACHGAPDPNDTDVHVRKGMTCLGCHSARDIHGDGTLYDSAWQAGAVQVRCETCHKDLSASASHTVHHGTVDCSACHTREVPACLNCHIDSRLAGVSDVSIKADGLVYLVNHAGRVTLANVLTFVYKNGTAITVAPVYAHKITRQGRTCAECHGTANVKAVAAGTFVLSTFENGQLKPASGLVPVVDPAAWKVAFMGREGGKWVPLVNPLKPIVAFSGFSSPLSKAQLASLAIERK